ncbi:MULTISPECIES: hypothetical protein [Neobacillus]|uniref:Uncharacterized protein n=1 Tax=Neobacillus rhizophilus TaxID=2833579 RepID=A0A942U384_9BACI|nr:MULTISPECIES: hypothetical protein [Neobacillus]MBS4213820.1 hypothetical protein [Neobacillus rhizophilus]MBU8917776.1 hypothetical protein [Bacillus sp. FJAT-29953]
MIIKRNKFIISAGIVLSFFAVAVVSNYYSLDNTKRTCVENNKTPEVEQGLLGINWTVSCE